MADLDSMSTEEVVAHYQSRVRPNALNEPLKPVEYQADYLRQAGEIDKDTRRNPEQKIKAKMLLSRAALSRSGK